MPGRWGSERAPILFASLSLSKGVEEPYSRRNRWLNHWISIIQSSSIQWCQQRPWTVQHAPSWRPIGCTDMQRSLKALGNTRPWWTVWDRHARVCCSCVIWAATTHGKEALKAHEKEALNTRCIPAPSAHVLAHWDCKGISLHYLGPCMQIFSPCRICHFITVENTIIYTDLWQLGSMWWERFTWSAVQLIKKYWRRCNPSLWKRTCLQGTC